MLIYLIAINSGNHANIVFCGDAMHSARLFLSQEIFVCFRKVFNGMFFISGCFYVFRDVFISRKRYQVHIFDLLLRCFEKYLHLFTNFLVLKNFFRRNIFILFITVIECVIYAKINNY